MDALLLFNKFNEFQSRISNFDESLCSPRWYKIGAVLFRHWKDHAKHLWSNSTTVVPNLRIDVCLSVPCHTSLIFRLTGCSPQPPPGNTLQPPGSDGVCGAAHRRRLLCLNLLLSSPIQERAVGARGYRPGGSMAPQNLADKLTLSQPVEAD